MRQWVGAGFGLILVAMPMFAVAARAAAPDPPPEPPITYVAPCRAHPDDPARIVITDTQKGPTVTLQRQGANALETRDANLAHKSRRFFFKLRTDDELIEFQGHARQDRLDGLYSDRAGARRIDMPVASQTAHDPCDRPAQR